MRKKRTEEWGFAVGGPLIFAVFLQNDYLHCAKLSKGNVEFQRKDLLCFCWKQLT
jgi:hypothetical protein